MHFLKRVTLGSGAERNAFGTRPAVCWNHQALVWLSTCEGEGKGEWREESTVWAPHCGERDDLAQRCSALCQGFHCLV